MTTKNKNLILSIVVVIVASSIPAIIFGKWIEAIIFILVHTLIRPQFKRQYHHIIPYVCMQITGTIFFFGICFVAPLSISLTSAIPINYLIAWVGCMKATSDYYERQCERLKEKYCNEKEDLLVKCRKAKLSERDTEIAIKYFYEKKTPKEIWLWICQHKVYEPIEWDCIYILINRIGKKIKNIK